MNEREHTTFIFSTHDAMYWHARKVIKIKDGLIVEE